jgi:hypothetical protein
MKKHFNTFMLIFLVFSMALPIYSMAGNLNIFTTDGYTVNISYKSLFMDEAGNVSVMSAGTRAQLGTDLAEPIITISNFQGVGVSGDNATGIVNGTIGNALSFNVVAWDSAATPQNPVALSCFYPTDPPGVFSSGSFAKTYPNAGTYYATFDASITDNGKTYIAQRMVKINIVDPAQQNYTLTTSVSPTNAGTVSPGGTYAPNTTVNLTATANSGFTFSSWSGLVAGDYSSGNTAQIIMNANKTITANFTQAATQNYTLTTSVSPTNAGTVSPGGTYAPNTTVDLTATANSGYTFSSWSGIAAGDTTSGNTAKIYMNTNKTITATFTASSTPPPSGETWVWDSYPMFWLSPGEEKVYIVNINQDYTYLKMSISGLTMNTAGSFTWTFPDGRVFPVDGMRQGIKDIVSMNQAGLLVLRAATNIPDNPIPKGSHVLRISASVASSYFKISMEVQ